MHFPTDIEAKTC